MPRRRKDRITRIDVSRLLRALVLISRGGAAEPDIREVTGLSRASNKRLLVYAHEQFGVRVRWLADFSQPSKGEYVIDDWGVLDPERVARHVARTK